MSHYLDKEESKAIAEHMAGMWNFEDESQHEQLIVSTTNGKKVLKPNREGGGHNIYGNDVPVRLREITAA